jgi:hypothetical protein
VSDEYIFGGLCSPEGWIPDSVSRRGLVERPRGFMHSRPDPDFLYLHLTHLRKASSIWGYSKVKLTFTTRRQDNMLASTYAQNSNRVRGAGQHSFEKWVDYLVTSPVGYYKDGGIKLDYTIWWKIATEALGRENVLVVPYEKLKRDTKDFIKKWVSFVSPESKNKVVKSIPKGGKKMVYTLTS